jgi:hypothetical protein
LTMLRGVHEHGASGTMYNVGTTPTIIGVGVDSPQIKGGEVSTDRFHGSLPPPIQKVPFNAYIWSRKSPARVSRSSKPFKNQGRLEGVG